MAITFFKGRKAIFFSFLSVFILVALILIFSFVFKPKTYAVVQESEHDQILLANTHLQFLRTTYLENALRQSARFAILSYIQEMHEEGDFIIDCYQGSNCGNDEEEIEQLKEILKNLMVTGNMQGNISLSPDGLFATEDYEDFTLINYLNRIRNLYWNQFQITITFYDDDGDPWPLRWDGQLDPTQEFIEEEILPKIQIDQDLAFSFKTNFTISYEVSLHDEKIKWRYDNHHITTSVPIIGLIDPVYMIYSRQQMGRNYEFNNTIREDSKPRRTRNELIQVYEDMKYMAAPGLAPSYFQKLVNSDNPSDCCGIESFVNMNRMIGRDIPPQALVSDWYLRSGVDYLFFYYERGEKNVFNCQELVGQDNLQLYYFGNLESPPGNPTYFNIHTFYAEKYNMTDTLGGGVCEFSAECQEDSACPGNPTS
jgi:hypothetical protein